MPTIIRQNGFEVVIYIRDEHPPPHVHVWKAEGEAIVRLGEAPNSSVLVATNRMRRRDAQIALDIVNEFQQELMARWREIHG